MRATSPPAVLLALLPCACAGAPSAPRAQDERPLLTLEDLYGPEGRRVDFTGRRAGGPTWIDGARWLERRTDPETKRTSWEVIDALTGEARPFVDTSRAARAIAAIPGVDAETAARLAAPDPDRMSPQRDALLVEVADDLWVVRFDAETAVRLTDTPDVEEEEAQFSPDGAKVAFVAGNDLQVADARAGGATRLTLDGAPGVLNGKLDWLYQEEVYGRGTFRAFWWSPDSRALAFLRLDEDGVPRYTLVDDATRDVRVETSPYPRAGERNPAVRLRTADVASGALADVDLSRWVADEPLIVDVSWSPDGRLVYQVQDREQRWLELRAAARDGGGDALLLRETSPAWVDRGDSPRWLADGTFLWLSERTGWRHVYRYRESECLGAVTSGAWEVRDVHGVDEARGLVYFQGTERSPIGSDAYAIGLDGRGLRRLTEREGTHAVRFSPDFGLFHDTWSDLWTPPQVSLHRADGALVRGIEESAEHKHLEYAYSRPELLTVEARDGFPMEAMLIKPVGWQPGRRYPVMMFVYGGPHAQTVRNAWGGTGGMFQQLLAQRGVLVWSCDNRTASGKGAVSAHPCYQRLGESELADVEDSIQWLVDQGLADPERVGITGWSYGGFLTSYALTHSRRFALGVAGGSVTDWRNYDSIYTERLMRTPANNPEGYARTSVVAAAEDLAGHLVLVHGAIDDNVHPANTMQLSYALQKAGKDFELMLYGKQRHGVVESALVRHWRGVLLGAIERVLLAEG